MDLDKLQSFGTLLTQRGQKLLDGIKSGAELLKFRPQIVTVGELRLITTSLIAEGGYSFVYTARELTSGVEQGRMFALKKVIAQDTDTIDIGRAEMHLLQTLPPHPHIIRYFGGSIENKERGITELYMVLEYCPHGSLIELVLPGRPQLAEPKLLSIFHSVCKAVAHLHSQTPPIAHRDLKLENVLCNANGLYKLCDFGSVTTRRVTLESRAERLREEETIQRFSTLMYRAPEMVNLYLGHPITEAVDVWALGCILYTLAFHKHPFDSGSELQIVNATVSFPPASPYVPDVHALINYALEPDPTKRPTVFELIERVAARRAAQMDDKVARADERQQQPSRSESTEIGGCFPLRARRSDAHERWREASAARTTLPAYGDVDGDGPSEAEQRQQLPQRQTMDQAMDNGAPVWDAFGAFARGSDGGQEPSERTLAHNEVGDLLGGDPLPAPAAAPHDALSRASSLAARTPACAASAGGACAGTCADGGSGLVAFPPIVAPLPPPAGELFVQSGRLESFGAAPLVADMTAAPLPARAGSAGSAGAPADGARGGGAADAFWSGAADAGTGGLAWSGAAGTAGAYAGDARADGAFGGSGALVDFGLASPLRRDAANAPQQPPPAAAQPPIGDGGGGGGEHLEWDILMASAPPLDAPLAAAGRGEALLGGASHGSVDTDFDDFMAAPPPAIGV